MGLTSIIKTQTRIIEKNILKIEKKISIIEHDSHETELDYFYLSSPSSLSKRIKQLDLTEYQPMDFSKIYLTFNDFLKSHKKISILNTNNEKKNKRNKEYNENQKSFYFEDYFETNLRNKKVKNSTISQDRVYLFYSFCFFH